MTPEAAPNRTLDVRSYFDPVECRSLAVNRSYECVWPAADHSVTYFSSKWHIINSYDFKMLNPS